MEHRERLITLMTLLGLQTWITEKMKVVESTDELGNDLAGVMALQRRLAGMERDLDAIQAKVWRFLLSIHQFIVGNVHQH